MSDTQYVNGLYPKPKGGNSPDFVIGKLSINLEQFMPWVRDWCKENPGEQWINIDMLTQKKDPTKGSAKLDTWKPEPASAPPAADVDSDLPF